MCDQLSRNALRRDLAAARAEVSTERDRDGRTVRALQSSRQALSEQNRENIQIIRNLGLDPVGGRPPRQFFVISFAGSVILF